MRPESATRPGGIEACQREDVARPIAAPGGPIPPRAAQFRGVCQHDPSEGDSVDLAPGGAEVGAYPMVHQAARRDDETHAPGLEGMEAGEEEPERHGQAANADDEGRPAACTGRREHDKQWGAEQRERAVGGGRDQTGGVIGGSVDRVRCWLRYPAPPPSAIGPCTLTARVLPPGHRHAPNYSPPTCAASTPVFPRDVVVIRRVAVALVGAVPARARGGAGVAPAARLRHRAPRPGPSGRGRGARLRAARRAPDRLPPPAPG
jgi:hypothetical protein